MVSFDQTDQPPWYARFLKPPHLPKLMQWVLVVLILSELLVVLLAQSPTYWVLLENANSPLFGLDKLMEIHPLLYPAVVLGYLALVLLTMRHLSLKFSLFLWIILSFIHLDTVSDWADCLLWQHFGLFETQCEWILNPVIETVQVIIVALAATLSLLPLVNPTNIQKGGGLSRWTGRFIAGISGVWLLLLTAGLIWLLLVPFKGWMALIPEVMPSARLRSGIAYNSDQQAALLFGGELGDTTKMADTWLWDGEEWLELTPLTSPSPRHSARMAYDPIRKKTVLFGGEGPNGWLYDTWEWDGSNWEFISDLPILPPPGGCCDHMYYDKDEQKVVMFAGESHLNVLTAKWAWNGQEWTQIQTGMSIPEVSGYTLAQNPEDHSVLAFYGQSTWRLTDSNWVAVGDQAVKTNNYAGSMAYEPNLDAYISYGGIDLDDQSVLDETWIFKDGQWLELKTPYNATTRWGQMMFYDEKRKAIMMLGGFDGTNPVGCMWQLNLKSIPDADS